MELRPIDTDYKGYRFRSRLEARWAVFFDAMDVKEPLINHRYFISIDKSVRESSLSRAFSGFGFPVIRS